MELQKGVCSLGVSEINCQESSAKGNERQLFKFLEFTEILLALRTVFYIPKPT